MSGACLWSGWACLCVGVETGEVCDVKLMRELTSKTQAGDGRRSGQGSVGRYAVESKQRKIEKLHMFCMY